jgi:membrane-bound serine protease (ClpP class)
MEINELLLNPNLAYLLLMVGGIIALLAIISPGTGILEIGALFILILAGWQVYYLPINLWALGVMVLGVVPFVAATRKFRQRSSQMILLVIAILAFVIGSSFLFRGDTWYQPATNPILAVLVSIVSAGFIWFAAIKVLETNQITPSHSLGTLIGTVGETRTAIKDEGSAQISGELWTVRSDTPIPANTKVRVVGRDGFILVVEPAAKKQ